MEQEIVSSISKELEEKRVRFARARSQKNVLRIDSALIVAGDGLPRDNQSTGRWLVEERLRAFQRIKNLLGVILEAYASGI